MGKIYEFLGLNVGCVVPGINDEERKKAYNCDITYGTNNEFGFDFLRDNMKFEINQMVQRSFNFAIIDEVDSILIDEARTPLVISGTTEDKSDQYFLSNKFIKQLINEDYEFGILIAQDDLNMATFDLDGVSLQAKKINQNLKLVPVKQIVENFLD